MQDYSQLERFGVHYCHPTPVGVDTHLDEHVAVAIDHHGARLGEYRLATTAKGYKGLESWAIGLGGVATFGIEGTGSYGVGLARYLAKCGHTVIEVNRPDRSTRRRLGKSDPLDAEMAARSVLAGVARESPKSGVDKVEMIRVLKITKDSGMKARTQAINQMKALVVTAPVELREELAGLNARRLVDRCISFRPGRLATPTAAAKHALRLLARRHSHLTYEIEGIDKELVRLTAETAPALVHTFGVGADTAATLLVTAGSNPERLRSESAFAALCGVNPIPCLFRQDQPPSIESRRRSTRQCRTLSRCPCATPPRRADEGIYAASYERGDDKA